MQQKLKCRFCARESASQTDFVFIRGQKGAYVVCVDCYFVIRYIMRETLQEMLERQ